VEVDQREISSNLDGTQCTEKELLKFLEVMVELTATFGSASSAGSGKRMFNSSLLQEIFEVFSAVREQTIEYRSELNAKAILKGEYEDMFTNADELYPDLTDLKDVRPPLPYFRHP
jgi:hypothetical protein